MTSRDRATGDMQHGHGSFSGALGRAETQFLPLAYDTAPANSDDLDHRSFIQSSRGLSFAGWRGRMVSRVRNDHASFDSVTPFERSNIVQALLDCFAVLFWLVYILLFVAGVVSALVSIFFF